MIDVNGVLNDVRKLADISYEQGYLNGQKHDADRLEQIKDLIRESDKNHAYTLSYPAYVFITRLKKIVGWQLEDYEERQTRYDIEKVYDPIEGGERYTFVPKKERQTDEIKVGDEVKVYDDCIGIVTRHAPQARTCYVMYRDGSCGEEELTDCKKTGNHSMSLDKWLEQMRKESHEKDT